MDKREITGAAGTRAPLGAPHETTAPGSERPTAEQVATARANEVERKPFNPGGDRPMTIEQQASFLGKTIPEIMAMRKDAGLNDDPPTVKVGVRTIPPNPAPAPVAPLPVGTVLGADGKPVTSSVRPMPPRPARSRLRRVHKPPTVVAGEPLEQQEPPEGLDPATLHGIMDHADYPETVPYMAQSRDRSSELHGFKEAINEGDPAAIVIGESAPALPPADPALHRPAASDTDSPSRGIPPASLPLGKEITGGFGDAGTAEYYPLDGTEARELVYALMDSIHARLQDDLRFSFAVTYPRITARVVVEIEAFGQDQTLTVEKVMVGDAAARGNRTPIEVARVYGDQVVFCVIAERAEMTAEGQSIAPPNQTRQELELPVPRKTAVGTPTGRQIVDVRG